MRESGEPTRRTVLLAAAGAYTVALQAKTSTQRPIDTAAGKVVLTGAAQPSAHIQLHLKWQGNVATPYVVNKGRTSVRVKEVVLFSLHHNLPPETPFYGEGFTMLSETAGSLGKPANLSPYLDARHYRIPEPADAKAYYGLVMLSPPGAAHILLAFTSCRRFSGKFYVRDGSIDVVTDTENLELEPGAKWELEQVTYRAGMDRGELLDSLATQISRHHPPHMPSKPPAGWCSWYMLAEKDGIVGASVTATQVLRNLDFMASHLPQLRYVQIDDGYSSAEGDWLTTGSAFGGDIKGILKQIRDRGFEPAIWVAPFIAEQSSQVFRDHPDWFVKDEAGKPLRSDRITFGGWRNGPWYALDGTNPEAQEHLRNVFQVMRREWGCTYFKLDANFWGAIHGGYHYDPKATRVEAYRRGMQAIWRGAGDDAFLLGCNHPLWPSLGLISGSRSSNDIDRTWKSFAETAMENLRRGWQNGKLWWVDPDCVLLTGDLPDNEYRFHATVAYACGGAVLSGDDLPSITPARLEMLRKLLPPNGSRTVFEDDSFSIGRISAKGRGMVCLLNWTEQPASFSVKLDKSTAIADFWDGTALGAHEGNYQLELAARSATILILN